MTASTYPYLPVLMVDDEPQALNSFETVLRSARRQNIDPNAFDPPSGYKRQEMFGGR